MKRLCDSKKAQFDFVWLFAIIAGIAILVLAIYGALKTGDTAEFAQTSEVAKRISILTDPLQAGFATSSFGKITFNEETRINNLCIEGGFGSNKVSVLVPSKSGDGWSELGVATTIPNKYIFSTERDSAKEYFIFSKQFNFPYKVADLIFMTSNNYCFINAPSRIVDDVSGLGVPNIAVENCKDSEMINVCFGSGGSSNCNIRIDGNCNDGSCKDQFEVGVVEKDGFELSYVGDLVYGAILSDKGLYDCNVKRLMYRTGKIAEGFSEKVDLMDARSCGSNLKNDLLIWKTSMDGAGVGDLRDLWFSKDELDRKNKVEICRVW